MIRKAALWLGMWMIWSAIHMAALAQEGEAFFSTTGSVTPDAPVLSITITQADGGADEEYRTLDAVIAAQDGSLTQTLRYTAREAPSLDEASISAWLEDMNFDGYADLCLLTAQGARNRFSCFALYNAQKGAFDPVYTICPWQSDENRFAQESVQLELSNYELYPQQRLIYSEVQDGFYYDTQIVYGWEGNSGLCEDSVASVYDAGKGMIGERLELFATDVCYCWNQVYPEEWYYGGNGVYEERRESIRALTLGDALTKPEWMRVAHTDWVNLRAQDSKASPSLARLNAGTCVQVLQTGCGEEAGWVRVWIRPGDAPGTDAAEDSGLTGYIWHSFLEKDE